MTYLFLKSGPPSITIFHICYPQVKRTEVRPTCFVALHNSQMEDFYGMIFISPLATRTINALNISLFSPSIIL